MPGFELRLLFWALGTGGIPAVHVLMISSSSLVCPDRYARYYHISSLELTEATGDPSYISYSNRPTAHQVASMASLESHTLASGLMNEKTGDLRLLRG